MHEVSTLVSNSSIEERTDERERSTYGSLWSVYAEVSLYEGSRRFTSPPPANQTRCRTIAAAAAAGDERRSMARRAS
jgi:hypothetical protein